MFRFEGELATGYNIRRIGKLGANNPSGEQRRKKATMAQRKYRRINLTTPRK